MKREGCKYMYTDYFVCVRVCVCCTVPGILNQLGPDSLASLRKLAEAYQAAQGGAGAEGEDEDDEIPDLVEGFEKTDIKEEAKEEVKAE